MPSIWPFKKKTLSSDQLPLDGPWSIAEGQHNGQVMIVRSNTAYREVGNVTGYEHQVGIAVPLNNAATTGLPSSAENAQLDEIEDAICDSLEERAESVFVAAVTTCGMREFVFYTREPQGVRLRFELLRNRITSHRIQLVIQPDAKWRIYAQLA